jgi:hypothetical protein
VEVAGSIEVEEIPSLHLAIVAGLGIGQVSFFSSARMNKVRILPQYIFSDLCPSVWSHRAKGWSQLEWFCFAIF